MKLFARRKIRRALAVGAATLFVVLIGLPASRMLRERGAAPLVGDERLAVDVRGDERGSTWVLLHGLAGSSRYFTGRADAVADRRLVSVDLLGFGRSPKPNTTYSLDLHARLVEDAVDTAKIGARPLLVGHSFGAVVALALATRRPDAYRGVVLLDLPMFTDREDAAIRLTRLSSMYGGMVRRDPWTRLSCAYHDAFRVPALSPLFGVPQDVYMDGTLHTWRSLESTLNDALLATDVGALARTARVPLLFLHGASDDIAAPERARVLADELGARYASYAGMDHHPLLRDPERVWADIRRFEAELHPK